MQGENPVKMKAEVYKPECRKLPPNHQKLGGGGSRFSFMALRPYRGLDLRLQPP